MTDIIFILADGTSRKAEGADGDTVMRTALKGGIPGIIGECGGEMSCATCHVYVEGLPVDDVRSQDETELLESLDEMRECSRLSCQIRVSSALAGVEFHVPRPD